MRLSWLLLLPMLLLIAGCIENSTVLQPPVLDSGSITAHFCPQENCEALLLDFLSSAEQSIYCALYDVNLQSVKDMLYEKSQEMAVNLLVDDGNFPHVSTLGFALPANPTGLMHNKFCVVDEKKVFTGSYNPTQKGTNETYNNVEIIQSGYLAKNYLDEFSEIWNAKLGIKARVMYPHVVLGNITMDNYFCPEDDCADKLLAEIRKANSSIYFLVYSFTDHFIADALVAKHAEGVLVQGLFDTSQSASEDSMYSLLKYQGLSVEKDQSKFVLHHKVFVIDEKTVVTGSYNPTVSGDTRNDENMLIIHDEGIAQRFIQEYLRLEAA